MQEHITNTQLESLMNRFNREYPNGDSFELAGFMFNTGFEAGEQGGLDETNFANPDGDPHKCYQPVAYSDDGTNIEYGNMPDGLFSFQAFRAREDCRQWLADRGFDPSNFAILEYDESDIEDLTIIEP